jgi:DNA helicase HerA-like ATPase
VSDTAAVRGDDQREDHRGLVLGTPGEASTPLGFWVFVDPQRFLQLDDVVHVQTTLPDGAAIDIYGVVDEVQARQEGVTLTSDVALAREGTLPAAPVVAAHVAVTRVDPEVYVPPMPGAEVALASGEARATALSFDRMDPNELLPLGRARTGQPVYGNLEFLDGGAGAHLNISGISGVATKTSYATYLLYALFEGGVLRERAANARAVIFNVKGEDLLFLDKPNAKLDEALHGEYAALGLPAGPFGSVAFYAPTRPGDVPMPDTGSRQVGVTACYWTLHEFCEKRYLRYLFAEPESDASQLFDVVEGVAARLARSAGETPFEVADGDVEIEGERVSSFGALVDLIESRLEPDEEGNAGAWSGGFGGAASGTLRAFLRRLRGAQRHVAPLIRGAGFGPADEHRIALERQVTVIDLHRLPDRAQRFVVGVVLAELMERGERRGVAGRQAPTFVMVDELNKYAPRDGRSPIKELLLDIAERGRSLGVILIGAQQTASEVEQRIVANASFRVVGRLDTAEATRGEYRYLGTARDRATLLTPGTMIVQQPEIPVPLLVQFPHPSWATRASEVATEATPSSPAPASLAAPADARGVEAADILDRFDK